MQSKYRFLLSTFSTLSYILMFIFLMVPVPIEIVISFLLTLLLLKAKFPCRAILDAFPKHLYHLPSTSCCQFPPLVPFLTHLWVSLFSPSSVSPYSLIPLMMSFLPPFCLLVMKAPLACSRSSSGKSEEDTGGMSCLPSATARGPDVPEFD